VLFLLFITLYAFDVTADVQWCRKRGRRQRQGEDKRLYINLEHKRILMKNLSALSMFRLRGVARVGSTSVVWQDRSHIGTLSAKVPRAACSK